MELTEILWVFLKIFLYMLSVSVFVVGILLVSYKNYGKVEETLGVEKGITKRIIPALESNIFSFHNWLLKRRTAIGIICIIAAAAGFVELREFMR